MELTMGISELDFPFGVELQPQINIYCSVVESSRMLGLEVTLEFIVQESGFAYRLRRSFAQSEREHANAFV